MGPTLAEVLSRLSTVHWTPLSDTCARVARRAIPSGLVEAYWPFGGQEFFRLTKEPK